MSNQKTSEKAIYFSILSNICLAIIKWLAGYFGNSYALVADAIESTTDVFSSILVLFGLKYANKPADKNHPYGHGRVEPLITFIAIGFLLISAVIIAYNSIINIRTPHAPPRGYTLIVLAAIILWKEISYRIIVRKSKKTNSSVLLADAWHHRTDAITSLAAFVGISIALLCGKGFETADDWAALFASLIIIYNSYKIFRPALGEIMDEQVYDKLLDRIKTVAASVEGIKETEKCYIRKAGMVYHVDMHARVDSTITVSKGHELSHHLKDRLLSEIPELGHILIHVEPHFEKKQHKPR